MHKTCLIIAFAILWISVNAQDKAELVIPEGHRTGQIQDILFNQENLVTIGYQELMFWNRKSGALVKKITGIETPRIDEISEMYDKSCNRIVVICNNTKNVKIINLENGEIVTEISEPHTEFEEALISADGRMFATASDDSAGSSTIRIWDVETGRHLQTPGVIQIKKSTSRRIQFSSDSRKLLFYNGESVNVWNIADSRQTLELKTSRPGRIFSAKFNAGGNRIISEVDFTSFVIWDADSGDIITEINLDPGTKRKNPLWIISRLLDARFTPDGKKALVAYRDTTRIWDMENGKFEGFVHGYPFLPQSNMVSNDGKRLITVMHDCIAGIWNLESMKQIYRMPLCIMPEEPGYVSFSADNKTIVANSWEKGKWNIYDAETGRLINQRPAGKSIISFFKYSKDSNDIAIAYKSSFLKNVKDIKNFAIVENSGNAPQVWNNNHELKYELKGRANSPNCLQVSASGKKVVVGYDNGRVIIYNTETAMPELNFKAHLCKIEDVAFNPSGNQILTAATDGKAKLWEVRSGRLLRVFHLGEGGQDSLNVNARFSPDGSKILTVRINDSVVKLWEARTGKLLFNLSISSRTPVNTSFNSNGNRIVTHSFSGGTQLWNAITGKLIASNEGHPATFSGKGELLIVADSDTKKYTVYNSGNGKKIRELKAEAYFGLSEMYMTKDDKNILSLSEDAPTLISLETGEEVLHFTKDKSVWNMGLSPDGNYLQTSSYHNFNLLDAQTGKLLLSVPENNVINSCTSFSNDSKNLIVVTDYAVNFWNIEKKELLYRFYSIDSTDYLYIDKDSRYDGTSNAIKLLNFSCNMELIGLDQVKEPLWEPGLASKIMNGDELEAKKLSDLDICGLTPLVSTTENEKEYIYSITPRKGGLGESIIYVNNIAINSYDSAQLTKTGNRHELRVNKDSLKQFFRDDISNNVSIRAFTSTNEVFARGDEFFFHDPVKRRGPVNMYAIIIGVGDYKGTELDLRFPAKDANDLSKALGIAARKLLNGDGKEHVFIYNLNTSNTRHHYPDKQSIRQVFEMVGSKATANDIVFVFVGGHGVLYSPKYGPVSARKQFYFLTADASKNSDYSKTGISMTELGEWMKPHNIRAQKRILIFDACNSGQAIDDLVAGIRAKGDESSRIKALERLNERSGMFILSASASSQSAYEMGRYSQGVLTYALLKVIREQPSILEDGRFLNVDKWFTAAEKKVIDIISQTRVRQQPQKFTTGGFNIGIVDNEVISSIVLAKEKPLFSSSILLHGSVKHDDIKLTKEVNKALGLLQTELNEVAFIPETESPDAYTLTGAYEINGTSITMTVNITQNSVIRYSFPVKGSRNDIPAFAMQIARRSGTWTGKK